MSRALWPYTVVGVTIDVWIVDVDGTRLVVESETSRQADPDLEQRSEISRRTNARRWCSGP
jgi:hypothetical protein